MSDWLYKISSYSLFLPILIAVYNHKYISSSLWWYFGGLLLANLNSIISIKLSEHGINNHFMIYVSACCTMIFRTFFFYTLLKSKIYKQILLFSLIIYLSGICIDLYLHGIYMNQYLFLVFNIWTIIFFLVALNQILKDESIESLREFPLFWVIIGTLIFQIFDLLLTALNSWLYNLNRSFIFFLWDYIVPIFIFIRVIFVSIGYWKTKYYAENLANS
ncbi:hypothetical protein [Emticicia aquatilis]|uniref:hypothetical protein n=1 Tax=Emticicia aquatilis TaxID=1537369 RepID=UPI00166B3251|nr:hypothetical protein [Emticicia aquatilis]